MMGGARVEASGADKAAAFVRNGLCGWSGWSVRLSVPFFFFFFFSLSLPPPPPSPPPEGAAQVAIQIGAEVSAQNAMLDSMSTGFDSAGGVLRSTMGRLKGLADGGSASHLIILVVVVVAVLFFAAYFLR